jgi:inorganic pyrophosphatase/exopolyphosphatase
MEENFKEEMKSKLADVKEFKKWDEMHEKLKYYETGSIGIEQIRNNDFQAFEKEVAATVMELKTKNLYMDGKELELRGEFENKRILNTYNREGQ